MNLRHKKTPEVVKAFALLPGFFVVSAVHHRFKINEHSISAKPIAISPPPRANPM